MIDYRKKENRLEGFLRYYYSILKSEDYDPAYYTLRYLIKRYELNFEQQFWLCWLYGFIYNVATAWVVLNEFPDFENVDLGRLTQWENEHWRKMNYETDTRYKKGKIQVALPDYLNRVREFETQKEYFNHLCSSEDRIKNFQNLWLSINDFKLFGRYSTFFYSETLSEVMKLPITCDSLFLRDVSGSKSHRNGLCYSLGKDEWDLHKSNPSFLGYSKEMLDFLETSADEILGKMKSRFQDIAHRVDYFTAETAWCAYKGFYRKRRYLGFYLDRDAEQIVEAEHSGFPGIDWSVFWQCRSENLQKNHLCENLNYRAPRKEYQSLFAETGQIMNLDWYFKDESKFTIYNLGYLF